VLTIQEIWKIYKKSLIKRMDQVRDVFLFSCFTGLAYKEVYNLTQNDIVIGNDGGRWIKINRVKTGNPEDVPLLPIPEAIISKYLHDKRCRESNRLLPVNSNVKYNAYLKELADLCRISKKLTTHIARHTFATTVTLENDVPIETVSKMLGHRSIRTTQIYARITKKKISNDMKELRKKLFFGGKLKLEDREDDRHKVAI
jgi:site-specific recombinase XerD